MRETCCQGLGISVDKNTFEKYESSKDEMFKKIPTLAKCLATDSFHGIIKMKKDGFVHFLTEKTYVAFKKVMVKIIYLQHAKLFPDEILNILMIKTLELYQWLVLKRQDYV